MDKGRKGPWIFYVDEDAHDQFKFKAPYGDKLQAALSGVSHDFAVTYGALADSAPRKSSDIRSSLKEVATYICRIRDRLPTLGVFEPTRSCCRGVSTNFIVSCHGGARRRSPPLLRVPRRGRPPSPHGAVAVEAAAPAIRGRAGARDPRRATRPVAPATPSTAAMLPPPGGELSADFSRT